MIEVTIYKRSIDPTHTTALRNLFSREMLHRFDEIIKVIKKSVIENNCFGFTDVITYQDVVSTQWQEFGYDNSQNKIAKFIEWLQKQVDISLLNKALFATVWFNKYLLDAYQRGVIRARQELIKAGYKVPTIEETGGIDIVIANPLHLDRMGLEFARVLSDLKGVTDQMASFMSRVLAEGFINGDSPSLIARKLVAVINGEGVGDLGLTDSLGRFIPARLRAEMIARTEIIRAHHLATIQEYRNWAVLGVIVKAELVTAGDERVCGKCLELEQGGPYTLDEAEKMIPVHPFCRCCVIPVVVN
jgi:SPP1 gp7 family putative phage head morphogenesis protein